MNIINSLKPYVPSPPKLARLEVRQELTRLQTVSDLREQNAACRVAISLDGQATYWSRGLAADTPLFLQHSVNGVKRVHILAPDRKSVGVFDSQGPDTWERRALLRLTPDILASLPKKALVAETSDAPASLKQLAAIRKMLDLPVDAPMPALGCLAVSRLIDRITIERSATLLFEEVKRWVAEPSQETTRVQAA